MNLSKSKYCTGLQCAIVLWMDRNMPEQKAEQDETRMIIGNAEYLLMTVKLFDKQNN